MLPYTALKNLFTAVYITVLSYPGTTEPDPTQITELEQVRPAVDGENGYAAFAQIAADKQRLARGIAAVQTRYTA